MKIRRFVFKAEYSVVFYETDFDPDTGHKDPVEGLRALTKNDAWDALYETQSKEIGWSLIKDSGVVDEE